MDGTSNNTSKISAVDRLLNLDKDETVEGNNKRSNRDRAAPQWIAHFFAVNDLIKQSIEAKILDPNNPEHLTAKNIERLLVESWEAKEAEKDTQVANLIIGQYTTSNIETA